MDLSSFVAADQQPSIGQIGVGVGVFVGVLVKTGVGELVGVRDGDGVGDGVGVRVSV